MPVRAMFEREVAATSDLSGHVETFVETLSAAGYVESSRRAKRRIVEAFLCWKQDARLAPADIDEARVDDYIEHVLRRPCQRGRCERSTLAQFLEHLREVRAVPLRRLPEPTPGELLVGKYVDHLRHVRGLSPRSLAVYTPIVRRFVLTRALGDADDVDAALDASVVREYVLDQAQGRSSEVTRLMTVALRSFLGFLFIDGLMSRDLSTAVPTARRWQLAGVPPLLSGDEVEQVLSAIDRTTATGRRALAVLLLVARLGLRPGEIVSLELGDLRWVTGEIVVRGKGGFEAHLPLLADVGEALSLYLQKDRGRSVSRCVFLRHCAPRVGFAGPSAVSAIARQSLTRAGIRLTHRAGAHLFRHALATRMLRNGASMAEISQALRHRSAATTRIYAKVDFTALRAVARPWPVAGGAR